MSSLHCSCSCDYGLYLLCCKFTDLFLWLRHRHSLGCLPSYVYFNSVTGSLSVPQLINFALTCWRLTFTINSSLKLKFRKWIKAKNRSAGQISRKLWIYKWSSPKADEPSVRSGPLLQWQHSMWITAWTVEGCTWVLTPGQLLTASMTLGTFPKFSLSVSVLVKWG